MLFPALSAQAANAFLCSFTFPATQPAMSYRLIVGLGNPGPEYEATRHNVGFRVIDHFAARLGFAPSDWKRERSLKGLLLQATHPNLDAGELLLLKPQTYMNESGASLQKTCSYFRVPPEEMIVIFDEINLPPGEVKASLSGSAGGHNGLADILRRIAPRFTRLRIGIGQKPRKEMDLADYVLGKFGAEEEALVSASMDRYTDCLERLLRDGPERAMNHINRRTIKDDSNQSQL